MSSKESDTTASSTAPAEGNRIARSDFQRSNIVEAELLSSLVHKLGHEIGNPLTSIISLGSIIDKFLRVPDSPLDEAKTADYARSIVKEAWRVSALTEKLVLLLSARDGNQQQNDLLNLVHSAMSKLRTRQQFDSDWVRLQIEDDSICAHCDADQTIILICECVLNAYQAVGAFEAEEAPEAPPIKLRLASEEGAAVIEVYTEQRFSCPFELSELFQPFTTSWEDQKHLGLGLSMASGIVERSGGTIEIEERRVDSGYHFITRVRLAADAASAQVAPEQPIANALSGAALFPDGGTVLIIDDEPTVASAISKILELSLESKESVSIECLSGEDALKRLEQGDTIDLILCDLNLEGMSGRHILETVQNTRRELVNRFAFVTGDASRADTELYLRSCGRPFLAKPFEPEALISLVESLVS